MSQHDEPTTSTTTAYDAFRDGFGADLVGAVREREAQRATPVRPRGRWRRRVSFALPAAAIAAVAFAVVDPFSPGAGDTRVLGVDAAAAAAVRDLSAVLERGVLVRVAVNRGKFDPVVTTESDWTDLATRDRHTRVRSTAGDTEFWNPSVHERWTVDHAWRTTDGRGVANYAKGDAGNSSSSASPREEVEELIKLVRSGELTSQRVGDELVVERTERCFASSDLGFMECPDPKKGPDRRWPDSPPGELEAVTAFETWWLAAEGPPRMLRLENGAIAAGSERREVMFRSEYRRWQVLPVTPENLRLVNPPAFPADRYLVLRGSNAVGDAIRAGRVTCVGRSPRNC